MNYEGELRMLCETFHKCRVSTVFINPGDPVDKTLNDIFCLLFGEETHLLTDAFIEQLRSNTIYRLSSSFHLSYILLRLPQLAQETVLAIGPYLPAPLNQREVLEIAEKYNIPPERVIRHYDVTGKKCPAYWVDDAAWKAEFWNQIAMPTAYKNEVQKRFGFDANTMAYLSRHPYPDALFMKLATKP